MVNNSQSAFSLQKHSKRFSSQEAEKKSEYESQGCHPCELGGGVTRQSHLH